MQQYGTILSRNLNEATLETSIALLLDQRQLDGALVRHLVDSAIANVKLGDDVSRPLRDLQAAIRRRASDRGASERKVVRAVEKEYGEPLVRTCCSSLRQFSEAASSRWSVEVAKNFDGHTVGVSLNSSTVGRDARTMPSSQKDCMSMHLLTAAVSRDYHALASRAGARWRGYRGARRRINADESIKSVPSSPFR